VFPPHSTELLHAILPGQIAEGDLAIDATAGNGHDTVMLARAVGASGKVIALDIQQVAIEATRGRLDNENLLDRVSLHGISHTRLGELAAPASAQAVVFNLGYLPGADREIITRTPDTLLALSAAVGLLRPGGILAVIAYPGHSSGMDEARAVEKFIHALPDHRIARYSLVATLNPAPFLLLARNGRKKL